MDLENVVENLTNEEFLQRYARAKEGRTSGHGKTYPAEASAFRALLSSVQSQRRPGCEGRRIQSKERPPLCIKIAKKSQRSGISRGGDEGAFRPPQRGGSGAQQGDRG
jgi:hypothetical protein